MKFERSQFLSQFIHKEKNWVESNFSVIIDAYENDELDGNCNKWIIVYYVDEEKRSYIIPEFYNSEVEAIASATSYNIFSKTITEQIDLTLNFDITGFSIAS